MRQIVALVANIDLSRPFRFGVPFRVITLFDGQLSVRFFPFSEATPASRALGI